MSKVTTLCTMSKSFGGCSSLCSGVGLILCYSRCAWWGSVGCKGVWYREWTDKVSCSVTAELSYFLYRYHCLAQDNPEGEITGRRALGDRIQLLSTSILKLLESESLTELFQDRSSQTSPREDKMMIGFHLWNLQKPLSKKGCPII